MTKEKMPDRIYIEHVADGRLNGLWHEDGPGVAYVRADLMRAPEPDWIDANGKRHRYKCGLNPDPAAMKHMVNHCTCLPTEPAARLCGCNPDYCMRAGMLSGVMPENVQCKRAAVEPTDDGLCWIKGCQKPRRHAGDCDPIGGPYTQAEPSAPLLSGISRGLGPLEDLRVLACKHGVAGGCSLCGNI
jgi:hypothetical protein